MKARFLSSTSLICRLFFDKNRMGKRWQGSYLLMQNIALKGNLSPEHVGKFPGGIPYEYSCPSTKDALMKRVCANCGLYFGSIESKQNHSPNCRSKKSAKSSDKQSTRAMRKARIERNRWHWLWWSWDWYYRDHSRTWSSCTWQYRACLKECIKSDKCT